MLLLDHRVVTGVGDADQLGAGRSARRAPRRTPSAAGRPMSRARPGWVPRRTRSRRRRPRSAIGHMNFVAVARFWASNRSAPCRISRVGHVDGRLRVGPPLPGRATSPPAPCDAGPNGSSAGSVVDPEAEGVDQHQRGARVGGDDRQFGGDHPAGRVADDVDALDAPGARPADGRRGRGRGGRRRARTRPRCRSRAARARRRDGARRGAPGTRHRPGAARSRAGTAAGCPCPSTTRSPRTGRPSGG